MVLVQLNQSNISDDAGGMLYHVHAPRFLGICYVGVITTDLQWAADYTALRWNATFSAAKTNTCIQDSRKSRNSDF